jgi:hypothetical protein
VGTLKDGLKKVMQRFAQLPEHEAPHRPSNARDITVESLYQVYADTCENTSVLDARNEKITFKAENFPYLIKLEFWNEKLGKWVDASPCVAIKQLKEKTFDATRYRVGDLSRARTLFWNKGILASPDCIHENNNPRMNEKDIYVMRYKCRKPEDAEIKVVLIAEREEGKVISSSFWTNETWLRKHAKIPALYARPNSKGCRCRQPLMPVTPGPGDSPFGR